MRDDSTPPAGPLSGPRHGLRLTDDDPPLSLNTVQPPEPIGPWRIAAVGAVGACVLGGVVGYMGLSHHPQNAGGTQVAEAAPQAAEYRPISARYAPPDRNQIQAAYRDVAQVVASEGLSGAARASMDCYGRLARRPEYGLMDYCLALDAFGAQAYERAAGESAPSSTYFGQAPVRRQQAVQRLTAGQTDANSRLIDTNRLIGEVVLTASTLEPVALEPQVAAVTTAPVAATPEPAPAPPAPKPAPEPSIKSIPTPVIVAKADPPKAAAVKAAPSAKPVQLAKTAPKAPLRPVKAPPAVLKAKTEARPAKGQKAAEPVKLVAKAKGAPAPARPPTVRPPSRLAVALDKLKPPVKPVAPVSPLQKASDKKPASAPWISQLEAELKGPKAQPVDKPAAKVESKPEPLKAEPPPAPVVAARPTPAVMVERKDPPPAPARAAPEPQRRVQRADAQPSFSCRGDLSRGQRMVCEEPSLAAADRRLSAAFNRALDESPNPRALIAEQNRWLAMRDRLAGDYGAVMNLYQNRISELRRGPY